MKFAAARWRWTLVAVLGVILVVGVFAGRWFHRRQLAHLFDGEALHRMEDLSGFYPNSPYDFSKTDWRSRRDSSQTDETESGLMDPSRSQEDWERAIEGSHPDWKLEGTTGATRVARLRSTTAYRARWVPRFLTITYPEEDAVFPPNLCAPAIEWSDVNNDLWQVRLRVPADDFEWRTLCDTRRQRIPDDVWKRIREQGEAEIEVRGVKRSGLWGKERETVHTSGIVRIRVSEDPADDFIVYRLVAPPFINKKTPSIYVRDIRKRSHRLLLDARQQYCFNCHTFSQKGNAGSMALQVRYIGSRKTDPKVYLSVFDLSRGRGRKVILPFRDQMTTFMQWSPDGTKLALSANQQIAGYLPVVYETQSIGQPTSDIAVYDTEKETAVLVKGAASPELLEVYPAWTPDGKSIVFSSAPRGHHPVSTQFDLVEVPYNDGAGGKPREIPVTKAGEEENPRSHVYARFSPDGRWMTFVKTDYGSLIKASSDIWIVPADFSEDARPLASNAPHAADSWHSWSSNSRWIVFASKRDDGVYARLYMTHIDDDGNASPPVRLPLDDPDLRMSFNIPEFVREAPAVTNSKLFEGVCIDADVVDASPADEDHGTSDSDNSNDR